MGMKSTSKSVVIGGHRIVYDHYEANGPTLILVHGITTYRFIWRTLVPLFPAGFNIMAIDLLGCGDSDKPLDESYSIKAHATRLFDFVEELGIKKFHLIGHDVGGGVSQIFAVNHPERLLSLSLINSVAYDFWPVQPIITMRTPIVRQLAMATLDLGMLRVIVNRGLHNKEKLTKELMDHFWYPMKTEIGRKAFLHFAKCLDNQNLMDIESDLRVLKVPTLIIRGAEDLYLSEKISRRLHEEITGSDLHILEGGSHFIQEDIPEMVAQIINEKFLS